MSRRPRRPDRLIAALAGACAVVLFAACSGDGNRTAAPSRSPAAAVTAPAAASATATPTTPPTAVATASAAATAAASADPPDVDGALAHLDALAVEIGSRPAGSEQERAAADYIAGVLTAAGYEVTLEPFPIELRFDESTVTLPAGNSIDATVFLEAPQTEVTGTLVLGGIGQAEELAGIPQGAIVLIDRGTLTFADKVRNAQNAGAAGVVVANNGPGVVRGSLGSLVPTIPALAITRADRAALAAATGQTVTMRPSAGTRAGTSQNVVARSGETCRVLLGAHYDSVPAGPGANDNGSGTATMIELARAHRTDGLCAVAFGAEEIGLVGSRAYVAGRDLSAVHAVLNFDMTGKITDALLIGDPTLTGTVLDLLTAAGGGFPIRAGRFPASASSDHVSFADVGVPALTVHSGDDELIHTARDDRANVDRESLETMLAIGDIAVAGVLAAVP